MQYYYYYSSTIVSIPASKALKRETLSTFAANGILEPIDGNLSSVPCNMGKPNTKSISRYFGRTFHTSAHICTVQPCMVPWYLLFVAAVIAFPIRWIIRIHSQHFLTTCTYYHTSQYMYGDTVIRHPIIGPGSI